jgi:hypothetical protein
VISPNKPVFSIDVTTFMWQGFMKEATAKWAIDDFAQPDGLVQVKVDAFTGLRPTAGARSIDEWFIGGTEPKDGVPEGMCGQDVLNLNGIWEGKFKNWVTADLDWIARAEKGPGTAGGVNRTRVMYFYNNGFRPFGNSWGALVAGHGCALPSPSVTCYPVPTADPSGVVPSFVVPSADPSANVVFEPCPAPSVLPSASVEPSAPPTEAPTPTPKKPTPTPEPPTPEPSTPGPSAAGASAAAASGAP